MPLRFAIRDAARGRLDPRAVSRIRRHAGRMVTAAALSDPNLGPPEDVEVDLSLVGDREIHELNREWRSQDRPTDVLSFSLREGEVASPHRGFLGDVVISIDTAARQARRRTLEDEVLFLWSHGLCHLLGYDHATDAEEKRMNARAAALLAEGQRRGPVRPA